MSAFCPFSAVSGVRCVGRSLPASDRLQHVTRFAASGIARAMYFRNYHFEAGGSRPGLTAAVATLRAKVFGPPGLRESRPQRPARGRTDARAGPSSGDGQWDLRRAPSMRSAKAFLEIGKG
jgi:hypothetical protein